MECPSVKSSYDSQESLHALGTPRAMATTVDAEIWKHNISDGCHWQNDTVWFATVFHKCSYKHRILNSGWIYCAVLIMWLHQRSSSNMEPWLASKVFLWPTILKQKLELWRHLSQVLLFTSDFHREQAWEKGFVTRNTAWVVKMLNGFLIMQLRACAWAPSADPCSKEPQDHHFKRAMNALKSSNLWKKNEDVCT